MLAGQRGERLQWMKMQNTRARINKNGKGSFKLSDELLNTMLYLWAPGIVF
jgi:hypothetical protein